MFFKFIPALTAATLLFFVTNTHAYDGRHDRGGLFVGGELGVSLSKGFAGDTENQFMDSNVGFNGALRFGGGIPDKPITLDLELGYNYDSWGEQSRHLTTLMIGGSFYVATDFYLHLAFGAARETYSGTNHRFGDLNFEDQLGLAANLGLGYEFFVNADLALGIKLDCDVVSANNDFILPGLSFTATWY